MISKKFFIMISFIILCAIHTIAQTDYYYYKGKIIPLFVNNDKICVSLTQGSEEISKIILKNVNVLKKIKDDTFDITVILRSDYEKIISSDFWKEHEKSVLITRSYTTTEKRELFSTPYLNVRLKREEDFNLLSSYAERYGLEIVKQDPLMPLWYILVLTQNCDKNPLECANELFESGDFASSVPDFCSEDLTCSNDPMYNMQWGLNNSNYPGVDISVSNAWNYSTGKNIKIAILDTGVELDHVDLASNISNLSYNTETNTSPSVVFREHGTHCAGIAAAIKDNGVQIAGVAPEATIVSISNSLEATSNSQLNPNRSLGPISSGDVKVFSCSPESKECLPLIYGSHKT